MKLLGKVVDNDDPKKGFRIKVAIPGYSDGIDKKNLEWYDQLPTTHKNASQLPDIDEWVEIHFDNNQPSWAFVDLKTKEFIDFIGDDYVTSITLAYRNLALQGHDGLFTIMWTKTDGIRIMLKDGIVQVRDDNSVFLSNGKQVIHVNDNKISLGSESKSAEPGVLGGKNEDALNALNDYTKDVTNIVMQSATQLGATAAPNVFTVALAPLFTALAVQLAPHISDTYAANKAKFPPTKSKIVSLD